MTIYWTYIINCMFEFLLSRGLICNPSFVDLYSGVCFVVDQNCIINSQSCPNIINTYYVRMFISN